MDLSTPPGLRLENYERLLKVRITNTYPITRMLKKKQINWSIRLFYFLIKCEDLQSIYASILSNNG